MKKANQKNQKFMPIGKAAEFLNVSIDTVRRYDRLGVLHSTRPNGKTRYFNLEELKKVSSSKSSATAIPVHLSKVKSSTLKAIRLKKVSLLLVKILLLLLTILTILFLLSPETMARLFTSFM